MVTHERDEHPGVTPRQFRDLRTGDVRCCATRAAVERFFDNRSPLHFEERQPDEFPGQADVVEQHWGQA